MLQNILGSKTTTAIGLILGLLTVIQSNGGGLFPDTWVATIGTIIGVGTMIFGGVVKTAPKK